MNTGAHNQLEQILTSDDLQSVATLTGEKKNLCEKNRIIKRTLYPSFLKNAWNHQIYTVK